MIRCLAGPAMPADQFPPIFAMYTLWQKKVMTIIRSKFYYYDEGPKNLKKNQKGYKSVANLK